MSGRRSESREESEREDFEAIRLDVRVRKRAGYANVIGIAMGINTMLTTDRGHCFDRDFGKLHDEYAAWVRIQASRYHKNKTANPGRKKYHAVRGRYEECLHSDINQELNRFLREERLEIIYSETSRYAGTDREQKQK